ncbi:succinyldiaminopimelate desuccinylase [Rhodoblastus acidophilus]|uniref:Succinyl-diaminopimelate desuccinylase n=1 Tax=Rhodoblastus acidophilus TaxID=1074 RepID=A0A212QYT4_RHOAC|nr:succinyl-diaminopimelate desuccinylase [Rhodoblastus acidophilus]PPQ40567.1 succinyl-diaminopimelate desuccinylase [Rhodoblastus acidophilus]RAI20703.1 succinyl-diaminopimelate desuccinylase [Rhodoblastus acidophilus]SNB64897.1 succinyldiaminopimelate desuccinylase [Rhodoblastus acidophilus]
MDELSPGVALARDLIRKASVTPADAGALDVLQQRLEAAGFSCRRLPFSEPGSPDIDNLYARIGSGAPYLLFAGHTDVVPPGDPAKWRADPFAGDIVDGELFGRGAADMKGGIAAFAAAALAYLSENPLRGSIGFLITGDEEGPAVNGTVKMLAWMAEQGEKFDHCIVGEPTNPNELGDMIKVGRRGSLNGRLRVIGQQGHVAYPQRADNPVGHVLALCAALKETPLDAGTAWFDASNLEITSIDIGNAATNVIPGEALVRFNVRFNDRWTPDTLKAEILRRLESARPPEKFALEFDPCNAVSFITEPDDFTARVASAIAAETGRRPEYSTSGGTSDARFIAQHGKVLEFGLVGKTMHQIDERVPVADIDALTRIYGRILQSYFDAAS